MPYADPDKQRAYMSAYHKRRYADPVKASIIADRTRERGIRNRAAFREWKATLSCSRCPESHPACLEFHHLDPSGKDFALSAYASKSLARLKREAAKCIVLCANCHRKEHASLPS